MTDAAGGWPREVACFLAPETGTVRLALRRYTEREGPWTCSAGFHQAFVDVGEEPERRGLLDEAHPEHGPVTLNEHNVSEYEGDPRWPAVCSRCPYRFTPEDRWQVFTERLYRVPDGRRVGVRDLPPGAMYDAWWMPEGRKVNGQALTVVLPDGAPWNIDGPATGGGRWTRTGEPPLITVTPSILSGSGPNAYHAFLTAGVLRAV